MGGAEKFGRPTKMAAHLEGLLEINFLGSPSKYGDGSPFNHSIGVALRILSNKGTQLDNPKQPACFNEPIVGTTNNRTSTQYLTAIHPA